MKSIYKLGGYETADMKEAKLFNHGERSMKIRKAFFRNLKKRYYRMLNKSEEL